MALKMKFIFFNKRRMTCDSPEGQGIDFYSENNYGANSIKNYIAVVIKDSLKCSHWGTYLVIIPSSEAIGACTW